MKEKEARIASEKVQGLLSEDLKKAEQEKLAADHQVRSNSFSEFYLSYTVQSIMFYQPLISFYLLQMM